MKMALLSAPTKLATGNPKAGSVPYGQAWDIKAEKLVILLVLSITMAIRLGTRITSMVELLTPILPAEVTNRIKTRKTEYIKWQPITAAI